VHSRLLVLSNVCKPIKSKLTVPDLPGFIKNIEAFKSKGVDTIISLAYNDPFVMSAWGKAQNVENNEILFMTDPGTAFSQQIGWTAGERTARYALAIDNGKVVYAEKEPAKGVTVSSNWLQ
jgi:alkyl hydroperoxide reductase 1